MTFEDFAAERLPALLRFAMALSGDQAIAEDAVQEVLVRAHGRWSVIGGLDRPEAYLRRMVVNEFISARRRSWRMIPLGQPENLDHDKVADHADEHAERSALLGELGRLPKRQRAVLVLRYYEGLSDLEIAEVLGCRPVTVRSYASRALQALRIELSGQLVPALTKREN